MFGHAVNCVPVTGWWRSLVGTQAIQAIDPKRSSGGSDSWPECGHTTSLTWRVRWTAGMLLLLPFDNRDRDRIASRGVVTEPCTPLKDERLVREAMCSFVAAHAPADCFQQGGNLRGTAYTSTKAPPVDATIYRARPQIAPYTSVRREWHNSGKEQGPTFADQ